MTTGTLRILVSFLVGCCAVLPCTGQTPAPEFKQEFAAGKQAIEQNQFADAASHFSKANQLRNNKCSECYVWLARIDMVQGRLAQALGETDNAVLTAASSSERASAQLYRGLIFGREGDLAGAEVAFKAAAAANPQCVECRFNLGFVLLKESKDAEGVEVLKNVAPEFAGTLRGREIQRFIEDPSRIRRNFAPEFSARLRNGEEVNLDTLKGKVVLLDFWGTWCSACRVSLPLLKELAANADPDKVAIVSIDEGDSPKKWAQFIDDNGMQWAQVYDEDRSLYRAFGIDGFPRYFVLSKDGIILDEFKGWNQNEPDKIAAALERALKH
jgi:thioredoxin-like negative regulator of GroEL